MDPLEHASIPALAYLALSSNPTAGLVLAIIIGAVFPDLDAFTREHRSYLHSLLLAVPITGLAYLAGNPYAILFSLGWLSHIFLDFFTGVIPFAYPLMRRGYGIEIFARGGTNGLRIEPKVLTRYPDPRREYEISIGGSVALALLTLAVMVLRLH
ncbi:metal-dependent hydrolase [Thermococcus sp. 5-4]|uniref:metal-dependent hydrolase n=1 Tax=Thermococcus sp. 5-4 TaxID=2008440 RepID=UPI000B4985DD|nr:metal-dependent hydrolase [Thermococcus sp. 5-4]ASA78197.1 hypothetical protein CDI07_07765 [Thermococcus sp. 5-4]